MDEKINIQAIKYDKKLCFSCLKKYKHVNVYEISNRGYGSKFDSFNSILQLCDECSKKVKKEWFNELPIINDYYETYKYENQISEYIKSLPIQGKELFENTCASGACAGWMMEQQDWIDYELGVLPHEKCKEYHMYSPEETKTYQSRFPICKHVKIYKYDDGSKISHCDIGAWGNGDGTAKGHKTQIECYGCACFELHDDEIMTVDLRQEEIQRIKVQIERLRTKLYELERQ